MCRKVRSNTALVCTASLGDRKSISVRDAAAIKPWALQDWKQPTCLAIPAKSGAELQLPPSPVGHSLVFCPHCTGLKPPLPSKPGRLQHQAHLGGALLCPSLCQVCLQDCSIRPWAFAPHSSLYSLWVAGKTHPHKQCTIDYDHWLLVNGTERNFRDFDLKSKIDYKFFFFPP